MKHKQILDYNNLLPSVFKTDNVLLPSMVENLFNRFVSEEKSVSLNGRIGKQVDGDPQIKEPTLERELNSLTPAIYYKTGTEETIESFDDLINKLEVLNTDIPNLRAWMAEQSFNFTAPIDYDKFINYANYFWVGQSLSNKPILSWNNTLSPEYYVIARPSDSDLVKMPVDLATTKNISLYANNRPPETLTIKFNSSTQFTITSDVGTVVSDVSTLSSTTEGAQTLVNVFTPDASGIDDPDSIRDALCSFYIVNGPTNFQPLDRILINITYFTSQIFINLASTNPSGKGTASGVRTTAQLMYVDGVQLKGGERVLVKNQNDKTENGIYRVIVGGKWARTEDATTDESLQVGSNVFVEGGQVNAQKTFQLTSKVPAVSTDDNLQSELIFTDVGYQAKKVNVWQEYNFWYHRDELESLIDTGYILDTAVQANRPIIEYNNDVQMNTYVSDGYPSDAGLPQTQVKTRMNQIPQFDLFRYDGTHAHMTSGIFFYQEDPDFPVDDVIQKRLKTTPNYDYIFGTGLADDQGRQLFYKKKGSLTGAWRPGVSAPTVISKKYTGSNTTSQININTKPTADNQDWTLSAISTTNFSVYGSRSGNVGELVVGTQFECDDLSIGINPGSGAFVIGDTFTFSVHAPLTPRYVKKQPDGSIINYPGGYNGDNSDAITDGAWMTPLRMFQNLERETRDEISFGDIMEHFRNVIRNQDGFEGTSFGVNNSRTLDINNGLGGSIREFGSNFPLLVSMLIQKDVSPLSIIDFAEQQYINALASIDQFMIDEFPDYLADEVVLTQGIDYTNATIQKLADHFELVRALNFNLKEVFNDTTAKVKFWPATLPMIGMLPAVLPTVAFDNELGVDTIIHHDGHISMLAITDEEFDKTLVKNVVERSDGMKTPGIISANMPLTPYARQLWFKPAPDSIVRIFNVDYDTVETPAGQPGQLWFKRQTNTLYEWSAAVNEWVPSGISVASRWEILDTASIRNSLVLAIEDRLYKSVHPAQQLNLDLSIVSETYYAELELARFSAKYNYDTYAPDYKQADAFTWNYSSAPIEFYSANPDPVPVPARWFDVLKTHFNIPGVSLPTCRPNLEPWKLMNHSSKPSNWDAMYALSPSTRMWSDVMWTDIKAHFAASGHVDFKLSVNTATDALLPPYVNASSPGASEALTNLMFPNPNASYGFGDNGPIETVWEKSAEYGYGLARSYFRTYPLSFLDLTWGETYTHTADNLRLERNLQSSLPASKFLMHGDKLNIINEYTGDESAERFKLSTNSISWDGKGKVVFEVTHCANDLTIFSVTVNDQDVGLVAEGEEFSTSTVDGITFTGVTIDDLGIPFELGDKFTLTFFDDIVDPSYIPPTIPNNELGCEGCVSPDSPTTVSTIPMVKVMYDIKHTAAKTKKFKGLGQLFTNLLRFSYIDTDVSAAAQAYNGWTLKLAHRMGALIRQDTLTINTALGNLPPTAYSLILKKSTNTESKWISALRIQLVRMGSQTINEYENFIPSNDGSNWVFRVESYNPQHPEVEYYELDTNGDYQTFFALSKRSTSLEWRKYTTHISTKNTTMPVIITGVQNVLNFVFGYVDRLNDLGWRVNWTDKPVTDDETGRNLDWQLEVEKFVDRVYSGLRAGEGHVLNPFMQKLVLETPIGLMSKYTETNFIDVYSTQAAFDVLGSVIPVPKLQVIRGDEQTLTLSSTPIFSAHVFVDEFEHTILMNKKLSAEDSAVSIFDPFLGIRIDSAYINCIRQDTMDRKPTFDGFFLSGNDVKRNVTSSISNISNFYDANKTFLEKTTSEHALALLGYTPKDYFANLNITDTTQFNFWRGLIQAKGTNMTIDAFVNYKKFADAGVDEYWAYKLAEYGDAREKTFPEIKINPGDVTQKFARLQFYSQDDASYDPLPLYVQIENSDDSRWFSLDDLGKGLKFEAQKIVEDVEVGTDATFPAYVRLNNIFHNGDNAGPSITGPAPAEIISASLVKVSAPGIYTVEGYTWINPSKLSPIKLFDYKENTLIDEIGLWHPAIGLHAAAPLEVVNMIDSEDPAHYNYTTQITNNPNYRHLKHWGEREVGRVWWDTSNLSYIPYYDATIFPSRDTRHSRWGALAEWSSVDLCEWTSSTVHPSEYDALAASQEGNSELDVSVRASGKVAQKKYYTRDRIISIRPIAWSEAGVGNSNAHPSFGPAEAIKVFATADKLIADIGTTSAINLIAGRNFGAWKNNKPVGEVTITNALSYFVGSTFDFTSPVVTSTSNILSDVKLLPIEDQLGSRLGEIKILKQDNGSGVFVLRMMDSTGFFEDVEVADWYSTSLESNATMTYTFDQFGLSLVATRAAASAQDPVIYLEDLVDALANPSNDIYIREAVGYEQIIALPDTVFINDETDPDYATTEYEWKTWDVPTQDDLNNDLLSPRNTWRPYLGDTVTVPASASVVKAMKDNANTLTLRNGITIDRFSSTWTEWVPLVNTQSEVISDGTSYIEFTMGETIDVNRLTLYANGIRMNPSTYTITDNLIQIANVLPEGTTVTLLYRAYQPSSSELAFDPDVSDDKSIQTQYKLDYQYSVVDVRSEDGNITGQKYYFWVTEKTVPAPDKSMSLVQAKEILKNGPSTFTIFSRLLNGESGAAFDSCAVSGLGTLIGKNDSYKLRFLRDFTLRDDPEELNLKNTHTEWALIRKGQKSRIPKSLWDLVTDAVCGADIGGKPLPSQVRIDYDARNNTRTRYGFQQGQIFADTELVRKSVINTILNTTLNIKIGNRDITDYITSLNFDESEKWFADAESARATMSLIWNTARASQINEIFFEVLEDALANNYEFSDIFKTSFITVSSTTQIKESKQWEQIDEQY